MGRYCKAYPLKRFREFSGWTEELENLRRDRVSQTANSDAVPPQLKDDDFLYLQENLVVTDGIFIDENIIYEQVTEEWKDFCKNNLGFDVSDNRLTDTTDAEAVGDGVQ